MNVRKNFLILSSNSNVKIALDCSQKHFFLFFFEKNSKNDWKLTKVLLIYFLADKKEYSDWRVLKKCQIIAHFHFIEPNTPKCVIEQYKNSLTMKLFEKSIII